MRARRDAAIRGLKVMMVASVAIPVAIFSYASWISYRNTYAHADERLLASLGIMAEHTSGVFQSVDLTFAEQPDLDLVVKVNRFEMPPSNVNTQMGPISVPEMKLSNVELKGKLSAGRFVIENAKIGNPGDDLQGTLKGSIAKAAFNARSALERDPMLALTANDLARIDRVIDTYAPAYAQFRNQRGPLPRSKAAIETTFADARAWMRYLWVLGTSSVTYTDRIYVIAKGAHALQYSCVSGGDFDVAPTFPITACAPGDKRVA